MNGRARSRDDATRPVAGRVRRSLRPPCAGRIVGRRFRGQTGAGPPQNADFETEGATCIDDHGYDIFRTIDRRRGR
jgi:hypothetical protein